MASNAQHQARYRARQASSGRIRLDTYISAEAHATLTAQAKQKGVGVRLAIETAILNSSTASRKDQLTMRPAQPAEMTVAEFLEIERFKEQLPKMLINAELDARHLQANGGEEGVAHKARINAMLDANNLHRR